MKQSTKQFNVVLSLILVVLAIVSAVSITWSYFTSTNSKVGTMEFSDLQVQFVYYETEGGGFQTATGGTTIPLYVAKGEVIARDDPFNLASSHNGNAIHSLAIHNSGASCSAFVRFWIDAYVLDQNDLPKTENNYGKYFQFNYNSDVALANSGANRTNENVTYCHILAISGSDTNARRIGASITLSEEAPIELLGEKIKFYMSLEAVQSANGAVTQVFNDSKGYYHSWK